MFDLDQQAFFEMTIADKFCILPTDPDRWKIGEPEYLQKGKNCSIKVPVTVSAALAFKVNFTTYISVAKGPEESIKDINPDLSGILSDEKTVAQIKSAISKQMSAFQGPLPNKLQESLQRIADEGCTGIICILI